MDIIGELNIIASYINFQRGSLDFRNGNHNFLLITGGKPRVCCDGDDIDDNRVRLIPVYSRKKKKSSITRDGSGLLRAEVCTNRLIRSELYFDIVWSEISDKPREISTIIECRREAFDSSVWPKSLLKPGIGTLYHGGISRFLKIESDLGGTRGYPSR